SFMTACPPNDERYERIASRGVNLVKFRAGLLMIAAICGENFFHRRRRRHLSHSNSPFYSPSASAAFRERSTNRSSAQSMISDQDGNSKLPDRKSTRLNSSHRTISYAVFCL